MLLCLYYTHHSRIIQLICMLIYSKLQTFATLLFQILSFSSTNASKLLVCHALVNNSESIDRTVLIMSIVSAMSISIKKRDKQWSINRKCSSVAAHSLCCCLRQRRKDVEHNMNKAEPPALWAMIYSLGNQGNSACCSLAWSEWWRWYHPSGCRVLCPSLWSDCYKGRTAKHWVLLYSFLCFWCVALYHHQSSG